MLLVRMLLDLVRILMLAFTVPKLKELIAI
jgi:hypothetical protein